MTVPAIEADALGKRFGRRVARTLRDCSFRLPAGRVRAVVGPDGAGRSTLLAITAGLLTHTDGTITVLGTDPASARPRVGFVDQDKPLYPQLTIAETPRMGAGPNPGRWDADTARRRPNARAARGPASTSSMPCATANRPGTSASSPATASSPSPRSPTAR